MSMEDEVVKCRKNAIKTVQGAMMSHACHEPKKCRDNLGVDFKSENGTHLLVRPCHGDMPPTVAAKRRNEVAPLRAGQAVEKV